MSRAPGHHLPSTESPAVTRAPFFSIIIPAFNAQDTVQQTLESIQEQTDHDWEAIVIDDGSLDSTAAIVQLHASRDSRITLLTQSRSGPSEARNAGCRAARGSFLCFLDSDDTYLPRFLASQRRFIETHPGFDVYSCNVDMLMPDGTRRPFILRDDFNRTAKPVLSDFLDGNLFTVLTVVRPAAFWAVGGFRTLPTVEDYDLWLRMARASATFIHNPATLAIYRQRPGSKSDDELGTLRTYRTILAELLAAGDLSPFNDARTRASSRRFLGRSNQILLERRLRAGEFDRARRLFWQTRHRFRQTWRFMLHLGVVTVSPRLYASLIRRRPEPGSRFG